MSEAQGPTPTGTSKPYTSLAQALRAQRVPEQNHQFIADIVDAVGISSFIDRGRYIEAIRRGDGASLHIGKTYTNGFAADEEVVTQHGRLSLLPSEGRAPYQYAAHPSTLPAAPAPTRRRAAGSTRQPTTPRETTPRAAKAEERDYGVCDVCFMVRNAAGVCGCDD